jgi:hypothetical protein
MDLFDRIYCLDRVLRQSRYPVPHAVLQEKLECSRATTNRIIRDMRDFLCAPIQYDRTTEGYHYAQTGEHPYVLPGLWFNAAELHALLTVQHLLAEVQPGLLESHIAPLRERIERILNSKGTPQGDTTRRIRILRMEESVCSSSTMAAPKIKPLNAPSLRSASFITATTGTLTPGTMQKRRSGAFPWIVSCRPGCSMNRQGTYLRRN